MDVLVPDLGEFSDVEVIEIFVKPGDSVSAEDPLITLETDKAAMDVPSPAEGVVKDVKVSVGDRISTGDLIAELDEAAEGGAEGEGDGGQAEDRSGSESGEAAPQGEAREGAEAETEEHEAPQKKRSASATEQRTETEPKAERGRAGSASRGGREAEPASRDRDRGRVSSLPPIDERSFSRAHASPSVRKLARELGVDLGRVEGSGRKGRVTADDVKGYVKQILEAGAKAGLVWPEVPEVDYAQYGEIEVKPLSRIQKISGPRLHASWVNLPHVTQHDEADITDLEHTRQELKESAAERGIRLTPLAFVLRAVVIALDEFERFRASLTPDGSSLVMKKYTHVGFAVDTPNGLIVPVIRDADRKDVYELASGLAELSERARQGKLKAADLQGGVFTVSSLGGIGGTFFTPIIVAPEVAILGVSKSQWKPVWNGSEFVPRLILPLSLSYDHRVIDGAEAVRFTTRLVEILGDVERILEAIP